MKTSEFLEFGQFFHPISKERKHGKNQGKANQRKTTKPTNQQLNLNKTNQQPSWQTKPKQKHQPTKKPYKPTKPKTKNTNKTLQTNQPNKPTTLRTLRGAPVRSQPIRFGELGLRIHQGVRDCARSCLSCSNSWGIFPRKTQGKPEETMGKPMGKTRLVGKIIGKTIGKMGEKPTLLCINSLNHPRKKDYPRRPWQTRRYLVSGRFAGGGLHFCWFVWGDAFGDGRVTWQILLRWEMFGSSSLPRKCMDVTLQNSKP